MRYLAIGDIHGCLHALTTLVEFVGIEDDDVLITLGDYVDRGPDTAAVLDWLIDFGSRRRLIPIRGNHDVMMLTARENLRVRKNWLRCGGKAALESYASNGDAGSLDSVPDEHWAFLEETCRPYFETETHFFVHASADPEVPLDEQPDLMLYWERFNDPPPHQSGKTMVCGHTSQKSGMPKNVGHAVCIDTWACGDGWLTCLDPATGQMWQANQSGATRELK